MVLGWRKRKSNNKNNHLIIKPVTKFEIPTHFLCPITLDLMRDPVTLSSGITYDRDSIEMWLESGNFTCPVTNQILANFDRIPNHALRQIIQKWCTQNRCLGVQRIPTPHVPVVADEVLEILLILETSAKQLDKAGFMESIMIIQKWGAESERNRRSIAVNGTVNALAKAFDYFATAHGNGNDGTSVLKEILSALSWMIPFKDAAYTKFLGSEPSLRCMVRFLSHDGVALALKRNSAAVLEELMVTKQELVMEKFAKIEGLCETLMKLVRSGICPKITKSSLGLIYNLILYDNANIRSEFLDLGLVSLVLELLVESEKGVIVERGLGVIEALCGYENGREKVHENGLTIPVLVKKLLRVSNLATEFSVSAIWKLLLCYKNNENEEVIVSKAIVESLQVGAFQKLLLIIQVGCADETKEKATELLKLLNPYRPELECIESVDFKSLKRSF